jgi:hypothetical protein
MSLSLIAHALLAASAPAHSIDLHHLGASYDVEYRSVVETEAKTRMMGGPARPHAVRCDLTATIFVERHISGAGSGQAIRNTIAPTKVLEKTSYGPCSNTAARLEKLVASRSGEISTFLASAAEADRPSALAAIEAARSLAIN